MQTNVKSSNELTLVSDLKYLVGILIESSEHSYSNLVGGMMSVVKKIQHPMSELIKIEMIDAAERALAACLTRGRRPAARVAGRALVSRSPR